MSAIKKTIKHIYVEKLFGRYNYRLPNDELHEGLDQIFILYGDNGSGKTTILRLLFHLLATGRGKGHKTAIAKVPFKKFEIALSNGVLIWASRQDQDQGFGPYTLGIQEPCKTAEEFFIPLNEDGSLSIPDTEESPLTHFLVKIEKLGISPYLLSDDRTIYVDRLHRRYKTSYGQRIEHDIHWQQPSWRVDEAPQTIEVFLQTLLDDSIQMAHMAIRDRVLRASSIGDLSVSNLYLKAIERLVSNSNQQEHAITLNDITSRLTFIEQKSKDYSKFGFPLRFDKKDIQMQLELADPGQFKQILNILVPYIESVEEKIRSLEVTYREVNTFIDVLSDFINPKKVFYNIRNGLKLITEDGFNLSTKMLSSGERHLILMFCNTLVALDKQSIFIIDEPEISLNIKWQRKLINALKKIIGDKPVQYIFATHSMELIAKHDDSVVELSNIMDN